MIGAEDEAIAAFLASDVALEQPADLVVGFALQDLTDRTPSDRRWLDPIGPYRLPA